MEAVELDYRLNKAFLWACPVFINSSQLWQCNETIINGVTNVSRLFGSNAASTFANHAHQFNASQDGLRCSKRLEHQHRPGDAFDCTMILLEVIVEMFDRICSPRQEIAGVKSHKPEC